MDRFDWYGQHKLFTNTLNSYIKPCMTKFQGKSDYQHDEGTRAGVLLVNLGTPDAATKPALRRYLKEFLSDPRVIEVPQWIWWFILNGIILNTRPGKSAKAYKKVWTENGSPLLNYSLKQKAAIQQTLNVDLDSNVIVDIAMRYGNPSIESVLNKMREQNVNKLLVFPLYPQYSAATTASTFDAVSQVLKTWRLVPEFRFIQHYHDYDVYVSALVESIRRHWAEYGKPDKLLFSYHGIPKDYFLAGDPYHCECYKTTRLVVEQLGLNETEYMLCFQSRFGPREWLQPYTDISLQELAAQGIQHVQVICPGFSADCLETLEEIDIQNRDYFLSAGGSEFSYIPALNENTDHIEALVSIIKQHAQGWEEFSDNYNLKQRQQSLHDSKRRADKLKNNST